MNPRLLRIAAPALLAGVSLALGWLALRPREPVHAGRSLTEWLYNEDPQFEWIPNDVYGHIHDEFLDQLESGEPWPRPPGPAPGEARSLRPRREALLSLGTQAIPWLVDWMASQPRPLERLRAFARGRLAAPRFNPGGLTPVERRHVAAFEGFSELGRLAEPALPALSNLLQRPHPDLALAWSVARIGPRGIAILTGALTNADADIRDTAALALGLEGGASASAVPELLALVDRGAASYHVLGALGRIGCDPVLAAPALTRHLERIVRREADDEFNMTVLVLGLCGRPARPAIPHLIRLHETSDGSSREVIRLALSRIDADAAALLSREARPSVEGERLLP